MLYPNGYIKDSSVRASKSLYEMVGVYLGGNYQYQIQQFDKVGCSKISVDTFKCTFYLKATLSSEVAVAGMVPVVKSIEGRKTGTFVRRTGRWEYQLPN